MFKVFVNDGKEDLPTDDICYIVGKKGIFLKKKVGLMESIAQVDNISILEDVATSAKLNIPKIPGNIFAKVYKFTKEVYNIHKSESVTLLYYNSDSERFRVIIPKQEVSSASIKYTKDEVMKDYNLIGTIHSHAGFSAFHSSVDDTDEKNFDGIHITIGKLGENSFDLSSSIVSNGNRFICEPEEYIDGIEKLIPVESSKFINKDYILHDSLKNINFDPVWMDRVEKKVHIYRSGVSKYFTNFGAGNYFRNYPLNQVEQDPKQLDSFNNLGDLGEFDFGNDDYNPCEDCPFKNYKLDMMLEEIEDIEDVDNDKLEIDGVIYGY